MDKDVDETEVREWSLTRSVTNVTVVLLSPVIYAGMIFKFVITNS